MNGTIDRRPERNKQWRARYLAPNGKQPSKSFTTRRAANEWLRAEITKIDRGGWVDPDGGKRRYSDHAEDWTQGMLGIKEKTRIGYESLLRSRVLPAFGNTQLRHIRPADVRAWIASMSNEGLSPSRVRQAHQVLRASLDQAVRDGLLTTNPANDASLPRASRRKMIALNIEQVDALASLADEQQPGAGMLTTLLAYGGIRWGEAVALTVASLDPLHHRLHISASATEIGGRLVVGTPKSHRVRTVVLPKTLSDALAAHVVDLGAGPQDLIFTAPRGGTLRTANFRRRVWIPSRRQFATIYPGLGSLRVHDLRHTAASIAISCGANIMAVQRMLGHEKASVTLDVYGHLYTDDLERLAERIDLHMRGVA